ncbi:hypothetical protein B0H13DRAFT_1979520 [Mycena leptocephala]|nr:hypothetical protein B0H13DRAFT_1979520 [Mycena leptocephala]
MMVCGMRGGVEDDWTGEEDTRNAADVVRRLVMAILTGVENGSGWVSGKRRRRGGDGLSGCGVGESARSRARYSMSVITRTGVIGATGRWPRTEVSRLGAIIAGVTTSRLNGHRPVFSKAALMFASVKARTCARPYIARKFSFVMAWRFSRWNSSFSCVQYSFSVPKIATSSPW